MRSRLLFFFFSIAVSSFGQADRELRFTQPAQAFTESAPLGNGRLGAMVFGRPGTERIVLNEISMWSGGVQDANKPDAHQYLKPIQQLLLAGKNVEAQALLQQHFICAGPGTGRGQGAHVKYGCYQTLGDLIITWADTADAFSDYSRSLRLDSASSLTSWTRRGVAFREQVIVSAPANAILIRLTTSKKGGLSFTVAMTRKERAATTFTNNSELMSGTLDGGDGQDGIRYAAGLRIIPRDGTIHKSADGLVVTGASECLLIITAATDMHWPDVDQRGPDPAKKILGQQQAAAVMSWSQLLHEHVADFQSYFNRCSIRLGNASGARPSAGSQSTDNLRSLAERLTQLQRGKDDADLVSLYFNFGRYLLISSSRKSLPANLQGLWAEEYQTPWNGDYHTNINIQMNYWLTDVAGLPEIADPAFRLLEQMARFGKATAKAYYGADGWVTHSITNPWGFTAPGEGAEWGSSLTGGAWMATHVLQQYEFYPDKSLLLRYYPILKGAAQFFTSILIREPAHNWLVTAPSNSPENSFLMPDGQKASTCMGPTMDLQIGRQLLLGTAKAAHTLGVDRAWADSLIKIAAALAPNKVSPSTGGVQEWLEDYKEVEVQHRHVSPLYGLYPYDEITPWSTPQLATAAKMTLTRRGDEGTGWSRAWKIAFWARLGDGDHAYKMLRALWKPAGQDISGFEFSDAGTYPNLFDACPPFQIDGNFGAAAAIMEFFLQSQGEGEVIRLLPALPKAEIFQSGTVHGLHARNGFSLDFSWTNGTVTKLKLTSKYGRPCHIASMHGAVVRDDQGRRVNCSSAGGILTFATSAGRTYIVN